MAHPAALAARFSFSMLMILASGTRTLLEALNSALRARMHDDAIVQHVKIFLR
jgi:hypothetical protein